MMLSLMLRPDCASRNLPIHWFRVHGFTREGLLVDYMHMDQRLDRVLVTGEPYRDMKFGKIEVASFMVSTWDGCAPVDREEWRKLVVPLKTKRPSAGHFSDYKPTS